MTSPTSFTPQNEVVFKKSRTPGTKPELSEYAPDGIPKLLADKSAQKRCQTLRKS